MAAKRKFSKLATSVGFDLAHLFNRAIKQSLIAGINAATLATVHDSSNAAVHWMVAGASGRTSKPWARALGSLKDLRGTLGRKGKRTGRRPVLPVGYRGDDGANKDVAVKFVTLRERGEVIDRLVAGRNPETRFKFYHALAEGRFSEAYSAEEVGRYRNSANIDEAGNAAVAAALQAAERAVLAGQGRKVRR